MNIVELLEENNVEIRRHGEHHHVSEGWIGIDCPECSPKSGRFRLGINVNSLAVSCWNCGALSLSKSLAKHCQTKDYWQGKLGDVDRIKIDKRVYGKLQMPTGIREPYPMHVEYLTRRGFDYRELQSTWKIQYTGALSSHPWRIVIPIHRKGQVISWTCRSLRDDGLRYITATPEQSAFNPKHWLYGLDKAVGPSVIVHEGCLDVWKTGPGAVATLGLAYTRQQIALLARFARRIICFDSDKKAQARARKLANQLASLDGETLVVQLDSKDAGEASADEINALRNLL